MMSALPPPRPRHPWRAPLIALGVVVILVGAIVVAVVVAARTAVSEIDDVAVGDCVRVTDAGDGTVHARRSDCAGKRFTFYVASRSSAPAARCPTREYSRISFSGSGILCLAPNWRAGHCYEVPRSSSTAATYREARCAAVPTGADRSVYEVTRRVATADDPDCRSEEEAVSFALPRPTGYCLAIASDMPA